MHEFMHTLGVHHEHKRPDQSDYVSINYTNVQSGKAHNFQARDASNTELYSTAYSYESIMHYSRKVCAPVTCLLKCCCWQSLWMVFINF